MIGTLPDEKPRQCFEKPASSNVARTCKFGMCVNTPRQSVCKRIQLNMRRRRAMYKLFRRVGVVLSLADLSGSRVLI